MDVCKGARALNYNHVGTRYRWVSTYVSNVGKVFLLGRLLSSLLLAHYMLTLHARVPYTATLYRWAHRDAVT